MQWINKVVTIISVIGVLVACSPQKPVEQDLGLYVPPEPIPESVENQYNQWLHERHYVEIVPILVQTSKQVKDSLKAITDTSDIDQQQLLAKYVEQLNLVVSQLSVLVVPTDIQAAHSEFVDALQQALVLLENIDEAYFSEEWKKLGDIWGTSTQTLEEQLNTLDIPEIFQAVEKK